MKRSFLTGARARLIGIALVFAAPLLVACALYFGGWRPDAVHPHGDLVTPLRSLSDITLRGLDGRAVSLKALRPRWLLTVVAGSRCDEDCRRSLYVMRQVIAAQGRQAHRLLGVVVVTDTKLAAALHPTLQEQSQTVLVGAPAEFTRLVRDLEYPAGASPVQSGRMQLIDPLGNFMMSYAPDADPRGIIKDLARLLRASQVG